jgi:hypothetical protein
MPIPSLPRRHLLAYYLLLFFPCVLSFLNSPSVFRRVQAAGRQNAIIRHASSGSLLVVTNRDADVSPPDEEIDQEESILVSKSFSTPLLSQAPSVSSFILVKDWSDEALEKFTVAVNAVIEENPILTGKVTGKIKLWAASELSVLTGIYRPGSHSFVRQIELKNIPSPKNLDLAGQLDYIQKNVASRVGKKKSVMDQIKDESPLFGATVVALPDGYACIHVDMSHCVGDLMTYFQIVHQITDTELGKKVRPIEWENPLIRSHELFPDGFSKRDIARAYGLPFFVGILLHLPFMFQRKKEYMLLSRDKVKAKTDEYNAKGGEHVSSNDVMTAALCDANRSSDIFAFTRSMRGVTPGLHANTGGNLHCEVSFQRCAGRNPHFIRDMLKKGRYFEPGEFPLFESLTGRIGRITNCVVPSRQCSYGGATTVCYSPPEAFLDFCPMDTAIIFRANKDTFGVLHNFNEIEKSKFLDDLRQTG